MCAFLFKLTFIADFWYGAAAAAGNVRCTILNYVRKNQIIRTRAWCKRWRLCYFVCLYFIVLYMYIIYFISRRRTQGFSTVWISTHLKSVSAEHNPRVLYVYNFVHKSNGLYSNNDAAVKCSIYTYHERHHAPGSCCYMWRRGCCAINVYMYVYVCVHFM